MINKLVLQSVISKYYLNGLVESVKWEIKNNQLLIRFMSPNKDMLGRVTLNSFDLADTDVAIYNTSALNKLINITAGDLILNVSRLNKSSTKLFIADTKYNLEYSLADMMLISTVADIDEPEKYAVEIDLNEEIVAALIKAKGAMSDTDHLIIETSLSFDHDQLINFIIGDDSDHSNKITYSIPCLSNTNISLPFDANVFREILAANKDIEKGKISVNEEGLMKIIFEGEKTTSIYFLVRKNEQ